VLMNVLSRNSYTFSLCGCRRSTLDDAQCMLQDLVRRIHCECPFTSICNRHVHYQCRGNQYSCNLHVPASISTLLNSFCRQRLFSWQSAACFERVALFRNFRYVTLYSNSARRAAALVRKQCHFSRLENVARYINDN